METAGREIINAHVRDVYFQWCNVNDKQADENRFRTFTSKFLAMEAIANTRGESLQLNKWYDLTEEEYVAAEAKAKAEEESNIAAIALGAEVEARIAAEAEATEKAEEETRIATDALARAKAVKEKILVER
jgi:hypothetical protein